MEDSAQRNSNSVATSLLGVALGDSLGLPYEGLTKERASKLLKGELRQRLFFGHGFLSDDTLQSVLVLQSYYQHPDDVQAFQRNFSRRLVKWFLAIPPGVGLATVKACLKLCFGMGPSRSGVRSAGNGAAMRVAALGCALAHDPSKRLAYVEAASRVTHTSNEAITGAQLVALASSCATNGTVDSFDGLATDLAPDWTWDLSLPATGPSGYVVHSVNAAIQCWKRHPDDLEKAIRCAVGLGGDTDSVAAIVGGIVGASGQAAVPNQWKLWLGWPNASDLGGIANGTSLKSPYLKILFFHVLALPSILAFGLRRLGPPY